MDRNETTFCNHISICPDDLAIKGSKSCTTVRSPKMTLNGLALCCFMLHDALKCHQVLLDKMDPERGREGGGKVTIPNPKNT